LDRTSETFWRDRTAGPRDGNAPNPADAITGSASTYGAPGLRRRPICPPCAPH